MSGRDAETDRGRLHVIGAGFGRSGTTSLARALEILGYGPCYHMQVAMTRPGHARFWLRAHAGEAVDYRQFLSGYRSAVDWPACEFYRELLEIHPEAVVVLTLRDPDDWYDSVAETLWAVQGAWPSWLPSSILRMQDAVIWRSRFGGRFADRTAALDAYRAHVEDVRRHVPRERLLEYRVGDGWAPLCQFLGRSVPDQPFPRLNDRAWFRRVLVALRVSAWLVPVALLLAGAWLLHLAVR